jgi:hypothetical protein
MLPKESTTRDPHPRRSFIALLVWLIVLAFGFHALLSYQMRAGAPAHAPGQWPEASAIRFDSERCNLVMFAHPKCSCTDASLEELKIVMTRARGKLSPTICFYDPEGAAADWTQSRLVKAAREIPGLKVIIDLNGAIAARFGAETSGQVLAFDRRGRRVFEGGITGSRGHAGDNRGCAALIALADGETAEPAQAPVFGCSLRDGTTPNGEAL